MMNNKMKHIHKYMKVKFPSGYTVFKCMWSDCAHYVREELAEGRESICWRCQDVMVLNTANMILKKPHHPWCVRKYQKRSFIRITPQEVSSQESFDVNHLRSSHE